MMRLAMHDTLPCPCGNPLRYAACCGRWHAGPLHLQAPDATALMRSRYSAYVLKRAGYLRDTWHASTRPDVIDFDPGLRWLGLKVEQLRVTADDHVTVEFLARHKVGGRAYRMHEISRFVRESGRWFYLDGQVEGQAPA
jgi:SEC-C motif-containing protein